MELQILSNNGNQYNHHDISDRVARNIKTAHPRFYKAILALTDAAKLLHINPLVLVTQAALETGWGHYRGEMTPEHGNTGGIRSDDGQGFGRYPMIDEYPFHGARVHALHLAAYAGVYEPSGGQWYGRYSYVTPGTSRFNSVRYVEELGGLRNGAVVWASDPNYGEKLVDIHDRILGID